MTPAEAREAIYKPENHAVFSKAFLDKTGVAIWEEPTGRHARRVRRAWKLWTGLLTDDKFVIGLFRG